MSHVDDLLRTIKPHVLGWIQEAGGVSTGAAGGGLTAHALSGNAHTGLLADSQAPQFLKTDGSRQLTGNLSVGSGVTIDGVDLSAHVVSANAHHNQAHGLVSSDHSTSGLTTGHYLRASGATTFGFAAIQDVDLPSTIVRTSRTITAGAGLTGGGSLAADRTIDVGAGNGISVAADSVSVNQNYAFTWGALHTFSAGTRIAEGQQLQFGTDVALERAAANVLGLASGDALRSSNFASGVSGWAIDANGTAEFSNVFVRGELHAAVFVKDLIEAHAGTMVIAKSAGVLALDMVVPEAPEDHWFMYLNDPPGGGFLLDESDICRVKSEYSAGVGDTWFAIQARLDMGNGTQRYYCVYRYGTRGITYPAGGAVVDYGLSGQGVLMMTAELNYAPYYDVITHAGAPWTTQTLKVRLGNLAGVTDAVLSPSGYGLYADNVFLKGDLLAGGGKVKIFSDGITIAADSELVSYQNITWKNGATTFAETGAGFTAADQYWFTSVTSPVSETGRILISANYSTIGWSRIEMSTGSANEWIKFYCGAVENGYIFNIEDDKITITKDILPSGSVKIGSTGAYYTDIYVTNLHASTIEGSTIGGYTWSYSGDMNINPNNAAADTTLSIANTNATYKAHLSVEGDISLGGLIDGVDLAGHAASANAHHNQAHTLAGSDHTASGLTAGWVLRASGATTFAWAQLSHADLGSVSADQHHAGFIGLEDNAGTAVTPAADDRVQLLTGNSILSVTAGTNTVTFTVNQGNIDHGSIGGLGDDDHTHYVHNSTARTITAVHTFSPGSATAPFILSANAQGQTVTGLQADKLNKSVTAGDGIMGGGTLTSNVTVSANIDTSYGLVFDASSPKKIRINAGSGLTFSAGAIVPDWGTPTISTIQPDDSANAGSSTNPARSDHKHAIVAAAPGTNLSVSSANAEGSATSFSRSDHLHAIDASSDVGTSPAAALLKSTGAGGITLANLTVKGSVDVTNGGDFTVGANVFFVDVSQLNVGINCAPDPQFDLDVGGNFRAQGYIVGKHALQIKSANMICHFDGPLPYEENYLGELNGHMGQVGVPKGGVVFRPGKFGKAVQVAEATTNLFTDPSCEYDATLTQWTISGSMTKERSAEVPGYVGTYTAKLVCTTSAYFYKAIAVTASSYTLSFRVKKLDGSAVTSADCECLFNGGNVTPTYTSMEDGWYLLEYTGTATAGTRNFGVYVKTGKTIYVDCLHLENLDYRTPYCDGSLGGYSAAGAADGSGHSWSGTAHASTSSRLAGRLTYATEKLPISGTISMWIYTTALMSKNSNSRWMADCGGANGVRLYIDSSDVLRLVVGGSSRVAASVTDSTFAANTWHHICATWDAANNECKIFKNGVQFSSTGVYSAVTDDGGGWDVGHQDGNYPWPGWVDEFAIIGRVLSASEILAIYESDAPIFAETSTFHWRAGGQLAWADSEGLWMRDGSGNPVLGVSGVASKSWGGATLDTGDLLIGSYSASKYVLWDSSTSTLTVKGTINADDGNIGGWTINSSYLAKDTGTNATSAGMSPTDYPFYAGATFANRASAPFRVTPAGAVTATSGAIGGWTIDSTTGIKNSAGTALLRSAGNLAFGSTPPTASNSGTGIFIDSTGLYGLSSGSKQAYIDASTGKLVAGGGDTSIDSAGIRIRTGGSYTRIRWEDDSNNVKGVIFTTATQVGVERGDVGSNITGMWINYTSPSSNDTINIKVGGSAIFDLYSGYIKAQQELRVADGLYVGGVDTAVAAGNVVATGDVWCSGQISTDGGTTKWDLGGFTAGSDAASNGYVSVVIGATTYKLSTRA